MSDSACFVQFPHPGGEHWPDRGGGKGWNTFDSGHARKFMQLRGTWIAGDGSVHGGELWAWGEWEAQSELVRSLDASGAPGLPHHLWRPYYVIPRGGYERLHNTDPFIFGERFLYSNCKQPSRPGLRQLGRGSVIAFGSKRGGWVLDTVLVVADYIDYAAPEAHRALVDEVPGAFLAVTAGPLVGNGEEETLRLYRGATPDDRVDGMFSFFPAMPAGRGAGFRAAGRRARRALLHSDAGAEPQALMRARVRRAPRALGAARGAGARCRARARHVRGATPATSGIVDGVERSRSRFGDSGPGAG